MRKIRLPPVVLGAPSLDQDALFADLFSPSALSAVYSERFAQSRSKGTDRLSGRQFADRAAVQLSTASAKCIAGSYRYSPFLENLKTRGRARNPRVISIPTIRDRIVLHQLNRFLAAVFPECVTRNIASAYVRMVASDISAAPEDTFVCGCDIKSFYDSIQRERVAKLLRQRINVNQVVTLVVRAIATPTVPKSTRRSAYIDFKIARGVPQGLSISNILAAIALQEVDRAMTSFNVRYHRYVDDILMYGGEQDVRHAHKSLRARLQYRGLSLHPIGSSKSHIGPLAMPFGYLGYEFRHPRVTVRNATVERLLQSLAEKFSEYMHNTPERLQQLPGLTPEQLRDAFVLELNEKITGSISANRKYGWIAYFNQINDLSLLHKLDHAVVGLFARLPEFQGPPATLKKFRRAYFEMKFRPSGGYIQNYDRIITTQQMLAFLMERGRLAVGAVMEPAVVHRQFESYRRYILRSMQADEGATYQ